MYVFSNMKMCIHIWIIAKKLRILHNNYGKYKTSKDCTTVAKRIE